MQRTKKQANNSGNIRNLKNSTGLKIAVAGAAAILLLNILIGGWFAYHTVMTSKTNTDQYQAVFLNDGQVYFGKIHNINDEYVRLSNVYYLQNQSENNVVDPQEALENQSDMKLVALASRVHGPEDEMFIKSDNILFFQNLKPDSRVSEAIRGYRN